MANWIQRFLTAIDTHKAALDPHVAETLPVLLAGAKPKVIPTNTGWTETLVGDGAVAQKPGYLNLWTAGQVNSSALCTIGIPGLGKSITSPYKINWDKKLYILFMVARLGDDSELVSRLQLKQVSTIGAATALAVGLRADNYDLIGESYGTEIGEVELSTDLANILNFSILIVLDPDVPNIKWYVDGVLVGTQSTSAKIPSGYGTASSSLAVSLKNGATGGVAAELVVSDIFIWQEL